MSEYTNEQKATIVRRAVAIQKDKNWVQSSWATLAAHDGREYTLSCHYDNGDNEPRGNDLSPLMLRSHEMNNPSLYYLDKPCEPKTLVEAAASVCLEGAIMLAVLEAEQSMGCHYEIAAELRRHTADFSLFELNDHAGMSKDTVVQALDLMAQFYEGGARDGSRIEKLYRDTLDWSGVQA